MSRFKNVVIDLLLVIIFLFIFFGLDDSYEDSILSAQVLDEAIAQAYEQKKFAPGDAVAMK